MRILMMVQGEYGRRIAANVREHGPADWTIDIWQIPAVPPRILDDPADFLPASLPQADLVLALGESPSAAELVPEVARMSGARAVIAPVDRLEWLPPGLANQLRGWLAEIGVASVFPKPLCSLTEASYNLRRRKVEYDDLLIAEFAHYFGRPNLRLTCDPTTRVITVAEVERDSVCGCARYVAEHLIGVSVDEAEYEAGMLHHHFPCLAGMTIDPDYGDTLMHVSGNILREEVADQVAAWRQVAYLRPQGYVADDEV